MVEINNRIKANISKKFISDLLKSALRVLKIKQTVISVALVGKAEIKRLNGKYRHINKTTDVLSVNYILNKAGIDGEIIICYPIAQERVQTSKYSIRKEISKLLVHGLLHLAGYGHCKKKEAEEMERLENKLLNF
ncbi:MAG: rRNA maturation RNase YbeY [Candidatus Kuenenbacteria bacterium]